MAMLLGSLLGSLASGLFGGSSEKGLYRVRPDRKLIMIHEGEMVLPKKMANKIRGDPKYKNMVGKLPKKPGKLSKKDRDFLKK